MSVCRDAGVWDCTDRATVREVRDVFSSNRVQVKFRMAKVKQVHDVGVVAHAHRKVVGLDIYHEQATRVDILDSVKLAEREREVHHEEVGCKSAPQSS